mmetsp:Transcript_38733/g.50072  ORF Transcript_38733/g.50072 Transcript_38733/m.50072 type:complete len:367 (-) Transcript_38733:345-1445(-)
MNVNSKAKEMITFLSMLSTCHGAARNSKFKRFSLSNREKVFLLCIFFHLYFVSAFQRVSFFSKMKKARASIARKINMSSSSEKGQILGPIWAKKRILNYSKDISTTNGLDIQEEIKDLDKELRSSINDIFVDFIDIEKNRVDYVGIRESDQFKTFLQNCMKLRQINVLEMQEDERKAFFLNIYNALAIHSNIALGEPSNLFGRLKVYATASYQIGEHVLSMNDIENGVLRNNRPGATPFAKPQFKKEDPRIAMSLPCDPRIHFCLNCGAISCPPIRFYTAEDIDGQMDIATRGYMQQVEVDPTSRNIRLPKLLDYYERDFGANQEEILDWVSKYLPEETSNSIGSEDIRSFKVSYLPYNWNSNKSG